MSAPKIAIIFFLFLATYALNAYGQSQGLSDNLTNLDPSKFQTSQPMEYVTMGIFLTLIIIVILILKKQPPLGPRKFEV